jgi:hypothetical protein
MIDEKEPDEAKAKEVADFIKVERDRMEKLLRNAFPEDDDAAIYAKMNPNRSAT